jgi:two-component system, chemotaxis family, chemotaxis protein CheY
MKLLIVDDSNVIRQRIARISTNSRLPSLDIVGLARNGVEALSLFRNTMPNVVTMDLTMPELSGEEATEEMVKINPNVIILVVSALSDKPTALRALKKGAMGFIYKPFTDEELVKALIEVTQP